MPDIRYVFLSDMHLGAENSMLTDLVEGTPEANPAVAAEVMRGLVNCLQDLVGANETEWSKPTLVLGGDILELALADDHVAAMVFERFMELAFAHSERVFADTVYFVPGNHDHHLWEAARERHYADYVRSLPKDQPLGAPWHATKLIAAHEEASAPAMLLTALIQRDPRLTDIEVRTIYPNFGIVDDAGTRAVVFHHGHYSESIYLLVSTMTGMMFDRPPPEDVWEWEAENFAWVDFFWSTLGRSGRSGDEVMLTYEYLQSEDATRRLVDNLVRGLSKHTGHSLVRRLTMPLDHMVRLALDSVAHHVIQRERRRPEAVLRDQTELGLRQYVEGPVRRQLAAECNGEVPDHVTFLFGHTHKPFVDTRDYAGFPNTVSVANTGGWVIDTPEPKPHHGAAVLLFDEHLNGVSLTMYTQHEHDDEYGVSVVPIPSSAGDAGVFARRISELIDENPEPWTAFSTAVATAVRIRERNLRTIIEAGGAPVTPSI